MSSLIATTLIGIRNIIEQYTRGAEKITAVISEFGYSAKITVLRSWVRIRMVATLHSEFIRE
jgi:hypothetical protein